MLTFCFQVPLPKPLSYDKMYGNQSYSEYSGAPKTLDVLVEWVVPLLNDGYQDEPFEGVSTPNGEF